MQRIVLSHSTFIYNMHCRLIGACRKPAVTYAQHALLSHPCSRQYIRLQQYENRAGWLYVLQEGSTRVWNKLYSFIDPHTVPQCVMHCTLCILPQNNHICSRASPIQYRWLLSPSLLFTVPDMVSKSLTIKSYKPCCCIAVSLQANRVYN